MKKYRVLLAILALVFASLACQTVLGGGDSTDETETLAPSDDSGDIPTASPESSDDFDFSLGGDVEFALTGDAFNVVEVGGILTYQTNLSLDEVMAFYRDEFGKNSYTERDLLTVTTDITFNMVFDGHESGQAIVVQGTDLGDGTVNVSIFLEDV